MNYGELRTYFYDLLNRNDCTDALADTFISLGLRRIERVLRTPMQRTTVTTIIPSDFDGNLLIPSDYIGLYNISVNGVGVGRITKAQVDFVNGFTVDKNAFVFSPELTVGDTVEVDYYTEFNASVSDTTETAYSLIISDVVVYSALFFASDYFVDPRRDQYAATFKALAMEVQDMADNAEIMGGGMVITPYGGGIA